MEQRVNDLEERIRDALSEPGWSLPPWPDPMSRIHKAARRRLARHATVVAAAVAVVVVPFAAARGIFNDRAAARPNAVQGSPVTGRKSAVVPVFAGRLAGEVAYTCHDYICLMRPGGTGKRVLMATFPEWDPAWSPNGHSLAFRGYFGPAEGDYDIYIAAADGCHVQRLTHGLNGSAPAWSPTGRQIAFTASGIMIIDANGRNLQRLTHDTRWIDMSPAWSSTGRIAFVRNRHSSSGQIFTMTARGTGLRQLTHTSSGANNPAWSPNGSKIAFVSDAGVVEVANADGANQHTLSPRSWISSSPVWTPTGQVVFLAITKDMQSHAYIVSPDGKNLRRLTSRLDAAAASQGQLAWGNSALSAPRCSAAPKPH